MRPALLVLALLATPLAAQRLTPAVTSSFEGGDLTTIDTTKGTVRATAPVALTVTVRRWP